MLYISSAGHPSIYRMEPGAYLRSTFIDASADGKGTFFFGVLADAATNTLWACELTPVHGSTPQRLHSGLRSFDLATGAAKTHWELPGGNTMCNDLALGPDNAVYFTDTMNGRVYRLAAGGSAAELLLEHPSLAGVDGIAFLNGALYVNSIYSGKLLRLPIDGTGKAGVPIEIATDRPLQGPDGMRSAGDRLIVAENGGGRVSVLRVEGNRASVTVLKEGLKTPTGVAPLGDTIWITERATGRIVSTPLAP